MHALRLMPIGREGEIAQATELQPWAREVIAANVAHYERAGFTPPWVSYLAFEEARCVGVCAFKGRPVEGIVEIAYGTSPGEEGRGVATQMASALIEIAAAFPGVTVTAQTLPQENASTRILTKLRFRRDGIAQDADVGEVWVWRLGS
jgi:ribosomal-protein-alanine N-acetyltransferase